MQTLLFFMIMGGFPCDGVSLIWDRWPLQTPVSDLVACVNSTMEGGCPVANAGQEQVVSTGVQVALDGSDSSGPGLIQEYRWVQIDNGAPVVSLAGSDTPTATFQPTLSGTYTFSLEVREGCLVDTDQVSVVVADPINAPQELNFSLVTNGSSLGVPFTPVQVQQAPGEPNRLYILTLQGQIWIWENNQFLAQPYIDIATLLSNCFECNLTGMAFHPHYAANGFVYIKYAGRLLNGTGSDFDVRIAGFEGGMTPDVRGLGDGTDLITIPQPTDIHAGGSLVFGKDGLLYIATGDSGPQNDPNGNAQNPLLLLGKLLRYQVNNLNPPTIPASNPFVNDPNVLDPIFAVGFRNPWRVTVDRVTGDFYIGDNGQNSVEEVSFLSGDSLGGENFGWNVVEGNQCFNPPVGCDPSGLEPPIWDYPHTEGCSVIGGYVYRGPIGGLYGFYLYGDWCSGQLFLLRFENGSWVNRAVGVTGAPALAGTSLIGFGEDLDGNLYMCTGGSVYMLTGVTP